MMEENVMLRFMSLSSGSCGNCYYLESLHRDGTASAILIDAGVSVRTLKTRLLRNCIDWNSLGAVLITHDHMDHIRSLASYCKHLGKPVYATGCLHNALASRNFGEPYLGQCRMDLSEDGATEVCGFSVRHFIVPHDATQTVGYAIKSEDHQFVIMTDIGRMTDEAVEYASHADTVVVEANYDIDMLQSGPYPYELKMRICSGNGHLSNMECASAVKRFWHPGLKNIFLCHLSGHNNTPDRAYLSVRNALSEIGVSEEDVTLRTLPRSVCSPMFRL